MIMNNTSLEQVTRMAEQLTAADKLALVERLARKLREQTSEPSRKPQSLRGAWSDALPPDEDVEAAIREIRDEWKEELDGMEREGL